MTGDGNPGQRVLGIFLVMHNPCASSIRQAGRQARAEPDVSTQRSADRPVRESGSNGGKSNARPYRLVLSLFADATSCAKRAARKSR